MVHRGDGMEMMRKICEGLWTPWLFILFFGIGIYFSLRTGFFQLFAVRDWLGGTLGALLRPHVRKEKTKGSLTQFQAMATALGSTVGTSTIAGVATAIYFGGPGAVFWMWLSAFLGMMTGYAEKALTIRYRTRLPDGSYRGGPTEYMRQGLRAPWLARLFCVACLLASFTGGNLVQANSIASALHSSFSVPTLYSGLAIMLFCGFVIMGGISRIGQVSAMLVPLMALLFTAGGLFVLAQHMHEIPAAIHEILYSALSPQAFFGGTTGYAMLAGMRYGLARGVFTNEAGLGSSSMAHAVSESEGPHQQGLWGMLEVFLATIVIATISALVIMTSGIYRTEEALQSLETGLIDPEMIGVPLVLQSFESGMGSFAGIFLTLCLSLFALSSILGWSYYGERSLAELVGSTRGRFLYRFVFLLAIVFGSVADVSAVWELADLCNGLMALPNLVAILLLSPEVLRIWQEAEDAKLRMHREARLGRKKRLFV